MDVPHVVSDQNRAKIMSNQIIEIRYKAFNLQRFSSSDILKRPQNFVTIFHLLWRLLSKCQSKWEIVSNFVAFLEYLNFKLTYLHLFYVELCPPASFSQRHPNVFECPRKSPPGFVDLSPQAFWSASTSYDSRQPRTFLKTIEKENVY